MGLALPGESSGRTVYILLTIWGQQRKALKGYSEEWVEGRSHFPCDLPVQSDRFQKPKNDGPYSAERNDVPKSFKNGPG
jgi:hypothetical protein